MNYEFPNIYNIDDVLWAIEGRDEFVVAEKEGYTVINYNVMMADTFPPVEGTIEDRVRATTRRECRGIIFDSKTGDIIRRPFHKFFNVNEREETQDHVIDLSRPHAILEKLDGSMISPFVVDGEIIWGTKMGATDVAQPVEEFVRNSTYNQFARMCISNGWTPIFEWCSRKQRIVLDYKEDRLILTAMRHIKAGSYMNFDDMEAIYAIPNNIPVVRRFEPQTDMKAFIEYVHDLEDLEGFVVRFDDGHMLKLKCHWYIQIHKAKEAILQDRNIVELILEEKLDDIKAHLPAEDRDRLTQFESDFNDAVREVVYDIYTEIVDLSQREIDRKTFAIEIAPKMDPFVRPIIFALWDTDVVGNLEIFDKVRNTIRNNLSRNPKYEAIRDAWFPGLVFNG